MVSRPPWSSTNGRLAGPELGDRLTGTGVKSRVTGAAAPVIVPPPQEPAEPARERSSDLEVAQIGPGQFDEFGSLPGQDGPGGVQREALDLTVAELGRQRQLIPVGAHV